MTYEKIQQARAAGYSDSEIAAEISKNDPKAKAALEKGFALDAIFGPPQVVVGGEKEAQEIMEEEPSWKRQAAAVAANIAISEASKLGGTAAGAATGAAISTPTAGTAAPATVPVGAALGYVGGALSGGFAGSIAEQKIEGKQDISYGRASVNAVLNLIPGGAGKGAKYGPQWFRRFMGAAAKRPVLATATIGGAVGPTQVALEQLVETGELPSVETMVKVGLVTSVFGAGIGKTSQYAERLLGKFAGRSQDEIDKLVRAGNQDAVNYIDMVSQGVDPDDFISPSDAKTFVTEVVRTAKAKVAPSSVIGGDLAREIVEAQNVAMAGREIGSVLNKRMTSFINNSKDPDAIEKLVYDYATGAQGPLPAELAPIADDVSFFRESVLKYQKELVDNHYKGQRTLPDVMLKKIEDSMNNGDYLTKEYRFFLDAEYKPSPKATKELKARLIADGMDNAQAESYIAELNAKKAVGPDEVERFVYSQNAGILKERKDLSPELRRYLGEIETIGEKMEGTMSKLSRLVAYDSADYNIRTGLRQMGLAKLPGEGVEGVDMVPLNLRRGLAKEGEEQLYVPKQVQTAINSLYAMGSDNLGTDYAKNVVQDFFESGIALSKALKVLVNPPSYSVQLVGNIVNVLGMGMNFFKGYGKGAKMAASQFVEIAKRLKSADVATLKKYKELGLLGQGISASDIRSGLSGKLGQKVRKPINVLGKAYSVLDVAGRVSVYENNLSFLREAFPFSGIIPKADDAMGKLSARMTNATYQNYDYLNQGLRTLSRYGVLGQFAAFSLELMRNQYNQVRLAKRMIDGSFAKEFVGEFGAANEKAIRNEGLKRLAALTIVYSASIAGVRLWNKQESGMTPEQIDAAKESVLPEWDKNRQLALKQTPDGKIYWKNVSYIVPHAQMAAPFVAAFGEEDFKSALLKGVETFSEDVGGEGNFLMNALVPAIQNYNPKTGDPISKKVDKIDNMLERTQWFAEDTWTPGIMREIERATSETKPQPMEQTIMRQAGIRLNDTTIEDGARFKINDLKKNLTSLSGDYSYQRNKKVGPELDEEYQRINETYKENVQQLSKHAQNYKILGLSEDQVIKLMRDNGIGANMALSAMDGEVIDLPKTPRLSITEKYEQLAGSRTEKENQIREIAKTEPFIAKSLVEKHKQVLIDDRLNISERDKAIRALGADDGTRAEYIWRQMQKSPDPDGTLQQYAQRKLVTPQVMYQIRLLRQSANQ